MIATIPDLLARASETRLTAALITAFAADHAMRWMYPDPGQYLTHFPEFVRAFGGKAFDYGTAETVNGLACAALWLPPGVSPDESAIVEVLSRSVSDARLRDVFQLLEQMGAHHPAEPHWYLPLIGVDPSQQGRGCGSALMRRSLARCDRDHLPAYLEASHPRNVGFYERLGFVRVGRIQAGTSPEIIPMIRPAR